MGVPPSLNIGSEVLLFTGLVSLDREEPILMLLLIIYSVITILYTLVLYAGLHHGKPSTHLGFYWQYPITYRVSTLLLTPACLLLFCMPAIL